MKKSCLPLLAATAASATSVQGAIVHSGLVNQSVSGSANTLAFNPPTGTVGTGVFEFSIVSDAEVNVLLTGEVDTGEGINHEIYKEDGASQYLRRFTSGDEIGAGLTGGSWGSFGSLTGDTNVWEDGEPGYLGLLLQASSSDSTHYGWAQVEVNDTLDGVTLIDFAYEDAPETAITAGAVPEPAHAAALLALGAVGVAAYRRRR